MIYLEGRERIELLSTYLYEYTIYVYRKNRAEMIFSKFLKSTKELNIKKKCIVDWKKKRDYVVEKSIQLLGAPQDYMDRHGLKPIE